MNSEQNNDLISIIVPCYNVEKYLDDFFKSILNLNLKKYELIIVDDGSKDQTPTLIDHYVKIVKNSNPKVLINVIHKENEGVSASRNLGLSKAKGNYIYFCDPDDYFDPNILKLLYENIKKDDYDISICGFKFVNENKKYFINKRNNKFKKEKIFLGHEDIMCNFLAMFPFFWATWNKLYKTDILKKHGDYPNIFSKICFDGDDALFNTQIFNNANKIIYSKSKMYYWRLRKRSISHSKMNSKSITILENEKYLKSLEPNSNKRILNHIRSKMCLDYFSLSWKFCFSDYKNPVIAKEAYNGYKSTLKYVVKADCNHWTYRYFMWLPKIALAPFIHRKFK